MDREEFYRIINEDKKMMNTKDPIEFFRYLLMKSYGYRTDNIESIDRTIEVLKKDGFPFEKVDKSLFDFMLVDADFIYEEFIRNISLLFTKTEYERLANILEGLSATLYSYSDRKQVELNHNDLYRMLRTYDEASDMIEIYCKNPYTRYCLENYMCILFAIYWIDGNMNFDDVYRLIKNYINSRISIDELCLMKGIDIHNFNHEVVRYLAQESEIFEEKPKKAIR